MINWTNNMKRFVLITNTTKDPTGKLTDQARQIIESNGGICKASLFNGKNSKNAYSRINPKLVPRDTDLVISLGGDGSLLHTAKDLIDLNIPIMGINLGTLGYLTEMDLTGFREEFKNIMNGACHVEERMLLKGTIIRDEKVIKEDIAINDIVLNRLGTMSIIKFDVMVNNRFLNSYNADGYIVCSPTGSTGYNLSAGGPVAHPVSEVIITTPICEHTLNSRSVVFSADAQIDIIVRQKEDEEKQIKAISFDGGNAIALKNGDIVRITAADKKMLNLRLDKLSFVEHLGKKMR